MPAQFPRTHSYPSPSPAPCLRPGFRVTSDDVVDPADACERLLDCSSPAEYCAVTLTAKVNDRLPSSNRRCRRRGGGPLATGHCTATFPTFLAMFCFGGAGSPRAFQCCWRRGRPAHIRREKPCCFRRAPKSPNLPPSPNRLRAFRQHNVMDRQLPTTVSIFPDAPPGNCMTEPL